MTTINIIDREDYTLTVNRHRYKDHWQIEILRQLPEYDSPLRLSLILSSEELSLFRKALDETS